jgi:4'-phosphopantetheinyl transferase
MGNRHQKISTIRCRELSEWRFEQLPYITGNAITDVWLVPVSTLLPAIPSLLPLLDDEEQRKAFRFRHEADIHRYIVSHGSLRLILSKYTSDMPEQIVYRNNPYGKPFLPCSHPHFNMAHSGDLVAIAVNQSEIGIDVEFLSRPFDYEEILSSVFCQQEITAIRNNDRPSELFFTLWTRKEALVKAIGCGLSSPLSGYCCLTTVDAPYMRYDWEILSLTPKENYRLSIAAHYPGNPLRIYEIRELSDLTH